MSETPRRKKHDTLPDTPIAKARSSGSVKIELGPTAVVNALRPWIDKILADIGHPEAVVTDESLVWDFLANPITRPAELARISSALGIHVETKDRIVDLAARLMERALKQT